MATDGRMHKEIMGYIDDIDIDRYMYMEVHPSYICIHIHTYNHIYDIFIVMIIYDILTMIYLIHL